MDHLFQSERIEAPDGQLIGIVLSTIFADYFEQLFSKIALSDSSSFAIFRDDGMLLVRYPQVALGIGTMFDRTENFNHWRTSLDHGVARITSTMDGKDRLIAGHSVTHYPLLITVSNTVDAILDGWRGEARAFGAGTIFLELVIAATVGLAIRHARSHVLLEAAEERERATHALQQQGQRFDTALNNMVQGLLMFDRAGSLLVVNRRFCRMFGVPDGALEPGMKYSEVTEAVVAAGQVTAEDMRDVRERRSRAACAQ